jgi:hypothetical protein
VLSDVDHAKKERELKRDEFLPAEGVIACISLLVVAVLVLVAFTRLVSI